MTLLLGLIYVVYFLLLGHAFRVAYNWFSNQELIIEKKTDFLAHAFFQGVFFHVVIFNVCQLLGLSTTTALILLSVLVFGCLALITWHIMTGGFKTQSMKPSTANVLIAVSLVAVFRVHSLEWRLVTQHRMGLLGSLGGQSTAVDQSWSGCKNCSIRCLGST